MAEIKIPNFFRDYEGSLEDFKSFYDGKSAADKAVIDSSVTFIHPTGTTFSDAKEDLGTYIYANKRFYPMCQCDESPTTTIPWPVKAYVSASSTPTTANVLIGSTNTQTLKVDYAYKTGVVEDTVPKTDIAWSAIWVNTTGYTGALEQEQLGTGDVTGTGQQDIVSRFDTQNDKKTTLLGAVVTYSYTKADGSTVTDNLTVESILKYHYPKWVGTVANNTTVDSLRAMSESEWSTLLNSLTKVTTGVGSKAYEGDITLNNSPSADKGKTLYIYDSSYGMLSSIQAADDNQELIKQSTGTVDLSGDVTGYGTATTTFRFYIKNETTGNGSPIHYKYN